MSNLLLRSRGYFFLFIKTPSYICYELSMEEEIGNYEKGYDLSNGSDEGQSDEALLRRRRKEDKRQRNVGPLAPPMEKSEIESKLRKKKKKEGNLTYSRFIAFLVVSPSVVYSFSILYDIISKYTVSGQVFHIGTLVLGFVIAGTLCTHFYKQLKPFIKYIALLSLFVFFLPSMQSFNCSPLPLDNSKLGTMLRLNEDVDSFLKAVYQNSTCWKNQYFKTPFEFSAYSPSLRVFVKPYQIINLGMQHFDEKDDTHDGPPPEILPFTLYLLTSPRSVKGQMYYLNMLVMVAGKERGIADVLELGVDDRENVTMHLTGYLKRMGAEFNNTKVELEEMQYLVRPFVFHVQETEASGMPEKDEEGDDRQKQNQKKEKKSHQESDDGFYDEE